MMTKTAYYMQMAQEAAAQITGSKEQWTAFLTTSARLYKYPFAEQLMIYKQRPEATGLCRVRSLERSDEPLCEAWLQGHCSFGHARRAAETAVCI